MKLLKYTDIENKINEQEESYYEKFLEMGFVERELSSRFLKFTLPFKFSENDYKTDCLTISQTSASIEYKTDNSIFYSTIKIQKFDVTDLTIEERLKIVYEKLLEIIPKRIKKLDIISWDKSLEACLKREGVMPQLIDNLEEKVKSNTRIKDVFLKMSYKEEYSDRRISIHLPDFKPHDYCTLIIDYTGCVYIQRYILSSRSYIGIEKKFCDVDINKSIEKIYKWIVGGKTDISKIIKDNMLKSLIDLDSKKTVKNSGIF